MKLDIGSGLKNPKTPLDEWIHLDMAPFPHVEIVADFGLIPLATGSVDEIFLGDVIEHIPMWRYDEVLPEWARILIPGGLVTGRTPNADSVMKRYARGDKDMPIHDVIGSLFGSGENDGQQHYMTFSKETLVELMANYGFVDFDFSGSPGPVNEPWWLVWTCRKAR
jgi:predicted SAM-dependent methyltransferase